MSSKTLNKIIILLVCVITIIIIILFTGNESPAPEEVKPVSLELVGSEKISIKRYNTYNEFGYRIVNGNSSDYHVTVDGTVNTDVVGTYTITYNLYDKNNKLISSVNRVVYVLEDDLETTKIELKGDAVEYYFKGDYVDHGAEAYRGNVNVTSTILVNSNVDSYSPGTYKVEYYITNGTAKKSITREVNIVDLDIIKKIDKKEHIIKLSINIRGYDHVVLPNSGTNTKSEITYKYGVSNMKDEYVFSIYLKNGTHREYIIKKDELGADKLNGSCTLSYADKKTILKMNMDDISLVSKFRVGSEDFIGTTKVISGYKSKVTVGVYNYANQVTKIICTGNPPTPTPSPTPKPKKSSTSSYLGMKKITGHPMGVVPCGTDFTQDNIELEKEIRKYGYRTRGAVMAAALFLANYRYEIPYKWDGKYYEKGMDPKWGCYGGWGLDCTALVKWCFIQAGFPADYIPKQGIANASWGDLNVYNFNANKYLFAFSPENLQAAAYIKPGDIVSTPHVHSALVIGVDEDYVQVTQESEGLNTIKIRKIDGKLPDGHDSGFTHFVLMDDFYRAYGNQ